MALCGCCASKPSPTNSASEDESTGPESKEEILLANQNGNASTYENIRKRSAAKRDKKHAEYGKRKMREVFAYYINHCTLHGFHYIFETKSLFRKIAWFSVLAIAGGFFFKEIKTSTTQYFKYPFSIMSTVEYPRTLVFPAVTICDFHDIRQTLVSNAKGEQAINISSSEKLETLARKTYKSFNETLISCSLRRGVRGARPFNIHDFKVFFTAKGQTCYTFNAAMDGKKLLEVDNVGPKFGLEIYLNAQHWWFKDDVRESGFRFILHQQDDLPLTREGFRVSSGYVTYVDMRLEKVKNLPYPFSSDCDGRGLDLYPKYSRNNCYMESLTKYILQQCKCRAWFMADVINTSTCSIKEALDCMWPAWEDFDNAYNYTCPVDCEERVYKTRLSSALFLPQKLLPLTKKYKFLMRPKGIPNDTEGAVDFILENYSVINLFFDELRLDTIQQTPAYGFFRLVGDVGGQLGLVLGASVITIVEIIDLVIMYSIYWIKSKTVPRAATS